MSVSELVRTLTPAASTSPPQPQRLSNSHSNSQGFNNSTYPRLSTPPLKIVTRLSSLNTGANEFPSPDAENYSPEQDARPQGGKTNKSIEAFEKLRRYGLSGILSYGLLNTAYYLTTFLVVWFYAAPAPGRMGYLAAVERFVKVLAMVWAGSQVTKLVRAGMALSVAPFVDRGLSWFTTKFKYESQGKAFMAIVGFCFGLAILMFFVVTLLSA